MQVVSEKTYNVIDGEPQRKPQALNAVTHGDSRTKLYNVWSSMKGRCNTKSYTGYKHYGGRGISYCIDWEKWVNFKSWAYSNGYEDGLQIDRIDNDGNYEPSNCRFISSKANSRKTRVLYNHNSSGYRGVSFKKNRNKFEAYIKVDNKKKSLGSFDYAYTAAMAYDSYVIKNNLEHTTNRSLLWK